MKMVLTLWSSGKCLRAPSGWWTPLSELPVYRTNYRWSNLITLVYTVYQVIFKARACEYGAQGKEKEKRTEHLSGSCRQCFLSRLTQNHCDRKLHFGGWDQNVKNLQHPSFNPGPELLIGPPSAFLIISGK